MKKSILAIIFVLPLLLFAGAPWADMFQRERRWMFVAYEYSSIASAIFMVVFAASLYVYRSSLFPLFRRWSVWLRKTRYLSCIITGALLAVPVGLLSSLFYYFAWFFAIVPISVVIILFIIALSIGRFRNKCLASPAFLKCLTVIILSAILGSLAFIILCQTNISADVHTSYFYIGTGEAYTRKFIIRYHPFDSLRQIWVYPLTFMGAIPVSLLFIGIGDLFRKLKSKLCTPKHLSV